MKVLNFTILIAFAVLDFRFASVTANAGLVYFLGMITVAFALVYTPFYRWLRKRIFR